MLQTVHKAGEVLNLFSVKHPEWGISELAKALTLPKSSTSLEAFQEELQRVRAQGYAYDLEEGVEELCCVAAPICDHSGEVVAAMSLSVPAYRFQQHKDQYRLAIVGAVRQISENLGYIVAKCARKKIL